MADGSDACAQARVRLAGQIDLLARELSHLSAARIAFAVDDIRREAQGSHLHAVATLASGLERTLGAGGAGASGAAVVLPYLEAMSDALGCDSARGTEALLAAVSLRLHG